VAWRSSGAYYACHQDGEGCAYGGPQGQVDYFISYTSSDLAWAGWIAWQLKEAGSSVVLQAWDMVPGLDFVHEMQKAATTAKQFERALEIGQATLGPEHPHIARIRGNLDFVLQQLGGK
jgi:hypothetical protein